MLERLAEKDTKWRSIALSICKDQMLADDLVNEMYLKLSDKKEPVTDFYVILTIKHLFYNYCNKNKRFLLLDIDVPNDEDFCNVASLINEEVTSKLTHTEAEVCLESVNNSYRKLEEKYNVNYMKLYRIDKKAKKKLKDNKTLKRIWLEVKK